MTKTLGYVKGDSSLHRMNPTGKLLSIIFMMIGILLYPSLILSTAILLTILLGFVVSHSSLKLASSRTRFIIIFSILLVFIQILLTINGEILLFLIPQIGSIGPFFPVTDFGIERGLIIALRFLIIVFSSMLYISTTDPTLLAHSLTKLKIPYKYAFSLVITLRFLPIFDSETDRVRMAQKSRGISIDISSPSRILRTLRYTFFPLLVSALSRVETLANSMDTRGFRYRDTRTYLRESKWSHIDSFQILISVLFMTLCFLLVIGTFPEISNFI